MNFPRLYKLAVLFCLNFPSSDEEYLIVHFDLTGRAEAWVSGISYEREKLPLEIPLVLLLLPDRDPMEERIRRHCRTCAQA